MTRFPLHLGPPLVSSHLVLPWKAIVQQSPVCCAGERTILIISIEVVGLCATCRLVGLEDESPPLGSCLEAGVLSLPFGARQTDSVLPLPSMQTHSL